MKRVTFKENNKGFAEQWQLQGWLLLLVISTQPLP